MRRWERNGCAVHTELPFRFSVIYTLYFYHLILLKYILISYMKIRVNEQLYLLYTKIIPLK